MITYRMAVLAAASMLVVAACGDDDAVTTEAPATTEAATTTEAPATTAAATTTEAPATTEAPFIAPDGALVSVAASEAPVLDGIADDAAWAGAEAITIPVSSGANMGSSEVTLKSVYSGDMVYFLVAWADPTESFVRSPWEKQADGTWAKLKDPADRGGDNNLYYEDKFSFIWNTAAAIEGFELQGCFTACHAGENSDVKPYGNKYTAAEGQIGDIWHWKSVRNIGQVDDQYLDSVRYSPETAGAGRHSDPSDGGGYVNNETEDKTMPAFMAPEGGAKDGSPGSILGSEAVPFDDSLFVAGDLVPGIVKSPFTGDRGDIAAGWAYADGVWTLEIGRALVTGSEFDVQFDDMGGTYHFGVAAFDNAQVRHAFQGGATPFVFMP